MTTSHVTVTISADEVIEIVRQRIDHIFGTDTFDNNANEVYCSIGNSILERIHTAFIQKSKGTTGDDGITWKPLSPITLRRRAKKKSGTPDLKDTVEYEQWRKVFVSTKYKLIARGLSSDKAEVEAAKAAWADLKSSGYYKNEHNDPSAFQILVENGDLIDSLKPSSDDVTPPQNPQTIFDVRPGKISVGTKEKPFHHKTRPFWPESLPDHWMQEVLHDVSVTIVNKIAEDLMGK